MIHRLRTIDAHTAGEPLRLIVEGYPTPRGRSMMDKRAYLRRHHDELRRALMLEPRGHPDMYGALFTEPVTPGAHAGVLFMHNEGYSTMCGHGVIAVVTIAIERSLIWLDTRTDRVEVAVPAPPDAAANWGPGPVELVLDSPAGLIRARAALKSGRQTRVDHVTFQNVPSFVLHAGIPVALGAREVRVDVAFGGAFYAIVDTEAVGVPLTPARLPELRRIGMEIKRSLESAHRIVHPLDASLEGIYGTIFTGPPNDPEAHLRNVTIFADAEVDRSPCGTGTAAVMAVLDAMGLLPEDRAFVHESLIGTLFRGRLISRTQVGDLPAIVPEIEGSAWITGEHTFLVDDEDPLREGFRI